MSDHPNYYVCRVPPGLQKAEEHRAEIANEARSMGHPPSHSSGRRSESNPRSSLDGKQIILQSEAEPSYTILSGPLSPQEMRDYLAANAADWSDDIEE